MKYVLIVVLFNWAHSFSYSQETFIVVTGKKTSYKLEIPSSFYQSNSIGTNVDLKYVNENGSSIITVVKPLPEDVSEEQINQLPLQPDQGFKDQLESDGMENVTIIRRGLKNINGRQSYYAYYTCSVSDDTYYYHTITQFRKGKLICLTISCNNLNKASYMAKINRIANSLN